MDYGYIFAHLTIILTLAATSGIFIGKLKQPIMIGYIIAGVLIGPSCFGLVASQEQVHFYSELGILLLLFVIGMELNIKSFLKMWKVPTLFTVIQVLGSAILAVLLSHVFGFSVYVSLLTAFFTCLSSTAAIVKVLEYLGELKTDVGHISIGILVAQDIAVVPMMLIIKECGKPLGISIVLELAFAIGLVVFMLKYLGKKEQQIKLPINHIIPNPELVPVVTLASVFIAATIVALFGLSEAYGAFLAGLFIGNTQARQNVLNSIKPIQNVLLMVFFLSVGLMFDLRFLLQNWFIVLISLILVTTWKIFFNSIILRMFSIELAKATSIGIILAQLGEFSLVLATVATQSGIIGSYGQKLIICITALSLSISPLFIALSKKTRNLSFVGDNSANSIIKTMFSGRFSKLVEILIERSKNTIKNQIEKAKASKMQVDNSTEKELVTVSSNNIQSDTINNTNEVINNNAVVENVVQENNASIVQTNNDEKHNQLTIVEKNKSIAKTEQIEENNETNSNINNQEVVNNSEQKINSNEGLFSVDNINHNTETNNINIDNKKELDNSDTSNNDKEINNNEEQQNIGETSHNTEVNNINTVLQEDKTEVKSSNNNIDNNTDTNVIDSSPNNEVNNIDENNNLNNATDIDNKTSNIDSNNALSSNDSNTELKMENNKQEEIKQETNENIVTDNDSYISEDTLDNKKKSKRIRKLFKSKNKK